jgi:hypothetical protein
MVSVYLRLAPDAGELRSGNSHYHAAFLATKNHRSIQKERNLKLSLSHFLLSIW